MNNAQIKTVVIEKVRFAVKQQIARYMLHGLSDPAIDILLEDASRDLVARLAVNLLGDHQTKTHERSEYVPADWWQAVRQRWAPAW